MDMNLLCQLWTLNETISELTFRVKERIKHEEDNQDEDGNYDNVQNFNFIYC